MRTRANWFRFGRAAAFLALAAAPVQADQEAPTEAEWIDPVGALINRIETGQAVLAFDSAQGYLVSLLDALEVPVSSQGLVFSRTSLQTDRISPWSPRALYFNDDVYVGFVQESPILEIASIDPDDGAVFYTLVQEDGDTPRFVRESTTCLMCHDSRTVTGGVPGVMVRSTLTDRFGYPVTPVHEGATSDRTPLTERLGGWYVTGSVGGVAHAGNSMAPELAHEITDTQRYLRDFDMASDGLVEDLSKRFDSSPYLSAHSDIVALLVLTHQTRVHNLITLVQENTREALVQQEAVIRSTGQEMPESGLLPSSRVRIEGSVDRLVREMFFAREAPLGGPIVGSTSYAEEFSARGPVDARGRSLRDFDLNERLFQYPLSFLIYSDAFDALPMVAKRMIYARMRGVLDGTDPDEAFQHLTEPARTAIREILAETKPEFTELTAG